MPHTAPPPSLFTFGSMSLGTHLDRIPDHIRVARAAMEAGVWFHTSPTYNRGFTYMVLRMAFEEARQQVPPIIVKIRVGWPRLLRFEVEDALRRMNLERIDVAQLVFVETGGPSQLVADFANGGPLKDECDALRREGKVGQFCPQIDHAASPAFLPIADKFDGYLIYLNPLQRDADDSMWRHFETKQTPLWALRTLAGAAGEPAMLDKRRTEAKDPAAIARAERFAAIAAQAGCDWTTFCIRYAASVPMLKTTIGGTGDMAHLNALLNAARDAKPLAADVMASIDDLRAAG